MYYLLSMQHIVHIGFKLHKLVLFKKGDEQALRFQYHTEKCQKKYKKKNLAREV